MAGYRERCLKRKADELKQQLRDVVRGLESVARELVKARAKDALEEEQEKRWQERERKARERAALKRKREQVLAKKKLAQRKASERKLWLVARRLKVPFVAGPLARFLPEKGVAFIAWKKANVYGKVKDAYGTYPHLGKILVKLEIPAHAKRASYYQNMVEVRKPKARASEAKVLEIVDYQDIGYDPKIHVVASSWDRKFYYREGKVVTPRKQPYYDLPAECAPGIHFFLRRDWAEEF